MSAHPFSRYIPLVGLVILCIGCVPSNYVAIGAVEGHVLSSASSGGLEGASVQVAGHPDSGVYSEADGYFALEPVYRRAWGTPLHHFAPETTVVVIASAPGCEAEEETIRQQPGQQNPQLDLVLDCEA